MTRQGPAVLGTNQAMAMLAYAALCQLWASADFQPGGEGCCHKCCDACAALRFLDEKGVLDEILSHWPGDTGSDDIFLPDGKLNRVWVYRQWSGSKAQEQCGHRLLLDPLGVPVPDGMSTKSMRELVEALDITGDPDSERACRTLLLRVADLELILKTRRRFNMSDPWGIESIVTGRSEES